MDANTATDSPTFVGVLVTRVHDSHLLRRTRECGRTFRYESHLNTASGISLKVSCLCPEGHGVARLPWAGWLETGRGRYDLADLPTPVHEIVYVETHLATVTALPQPIESATATAA